MQNNQTLPPMITAIKPTEFDAVQFEECYAPGTENHYWHVARSNVLLNQIHAAGGKRVLDVGCGRGILVEYLLARGIDCYGAELANLSLTGELSQRIYTGAPASALPAKFRDSIDTIILGDVIEHLPDPVEFLRELALAYRNLKNLIVAVPARQELFSNYDKFYGHYRRYDIELLESTLKAASFSPQATRYLFHALYPATKVLLSLRGRRSTKFRTGVRFQVLHRLLAALFVAEFSLLPGNWYGTSIICHAKRL